MTWFQTFAGEVAENCALLCYYAACSVNLLPKFLDNLSVPSSGFKNRETSVRNYHYSLLTGPEERSSVLSDTMSRQLSVQWRLCAKQEKFTC